MASPVVNRWNSRDARRHFDIYARVFQFAVDIIKFVRTLPRTVDGIEIGRQLVRAGPSVGANMEEADGAASRRDFAYRVGVSRREARESNYWLRVCFATDLGDKEQCTALIQESGEIVAILSSIIAKAEAPVEEQRR